jgi:hypothetical protein
VIGDAEYFEYLDTLRASGVTNMFGATPYLVREFALERKMAQKVLVRWMESYHPEKTPEQRAMEATA